MGEQKIILADRRDLLTSLRGTVLERKSFRWLVTGDGRKAYSLVEEEDPALVILTLDMAGLAGDACCRRIKNDPFLKDTPVILLSRIENEKNLARCRLAGCDEIIPLPHEGTVLLAAACRLLGIGPVSPPRPPVSIPVLCGRSDDLHDARTVDLTVGGAFLATGKLLPKDAPVEVRLLLPGLDAPLGIQARVAWVNHPEWIKKPAYPVGFGVEFLLMGGTDLDRLKGFLGEVSQRPDFALS